MRKIVFLVSFLMSGISVFGQQTQYNVTPGNGNGLRFWNSDTYKIHMGNSAEYKFGPVTDYSIKMNMSNTAGRGWTWGVSGATPIAGLNTFGDFEIARNFKAQSGLIDTDGYTGWIPFQIGRETEPGRRNFEFVVAPASNSREYMAFNIADLSKNSRFNVTVNPDVTSVSTKDASNREIFKVASGKTGDLNYTFLHMPKSESRIVIGGYGDYLRNEGYNLVVKNGTALIENAIYTNGQVGIGTTDTQGYELAVSGKAIAEEIRVKLQANWPDYVFAKNHQLPTLQQVEEHITKKGHLINIPSAAEVAKDGIYLGEMNAKLLEKIEELTLYTIAQEKRIENQEEEIKAQKNKIAVQKEINNQLLEKGTSLEIRIALIEQKLNKK